MPCVEQSHRAVGTQPWRADPLERVGCAPSDAHVRRLERHERGIDRRAGEGGEVRRGTHPRKAGLVEPHGSPPARRRHHVEPSADAQVRVEVARHLTHREAVPQRDGMQRVRLARPSG